MPDALLATAIDVGGDTGARLGTGLVVTVIGMGVVFGVLLLLYALMVLIGRFGGHTVARDQPAALANGAPPDGAQAASAAGAVAAEEAPVDVVTAGRPSRRAQVVAAVAAALAAAMESGASGPAVRHGRQTRTRRPQMDWARAGRMELVTARERLPRVRGARS